MASKFRSHFELFSFRQRTVEFVPTIRRLESVGEEQHGWICIHFLFVIWEPTDYSDSSALSTDCNCLISFPFRLCFPISEKTTRREIPSRGVEKTTRLMILHFKFELSISNGIKMTRLKNKTKIKGIGSAVQKYIHMDALHFELSFCLFWLAR